MTDKRISDLPEIPSVAADDEIEVTDVSTNTSSRSTFTKLLTFLLDYVNTKAEVTAGLATKAASVHTHTLAAIDDAGTAAANDTGDFATAAQGALADSATQPGDLAAVATSGDYDDLSNKPDLSVFDNVDEHANLAAFPGIGVTGRLYVAEDTGLMYRWNGSGYSVVSADLALGETSATAYRGDRGKTAYDHTFLTDNPHSVTKTQVGLGSVDNTADADKPISSATTAALDGKQASNANLSEVAGLSFTAGDILYVSAGGALAVLAAGSAAQLLTMAGGVPTWAAAPATSTPLTTKGDLLGYSTADARVPVGGNGQVLSADSSEAAGVKWITLGGGGDMVIATYDPTAVGSDAFNMDNMAEGATTKIMTATERSNLAAAFGWGDHAGLYQPLATVLTNTTASFLITHETKLGHISVTQAVDLDALESAVAALANGMVFEDDWDASAGSFPGGGTAQKGSFYYVTTGGTVDGITFVTGDAIVARVDNASTLDYSPNWRKLDATDAVTAVAGLTGSISAAALKAALDLEPGTDFYTIAAADAAFAAIGHDHSGTYEPVDADILRADTDDVLAALFQETMTDDGTQASGTYTPALTGSNAKKVIFNGALTFAPPAPASNVIVKMTILIVNGASAGAITTSGWTKFTGDAFTTTSGDEFLARICVYNVGGTTFSSCNLEAMQ